MKKSWKTAGRAIILVLLSVMSLNFYVEAQDYKSPNEINQWVQNLNARYPQKVKLHKIAVSPGGKDVYLVEIGTEVNESEKTKPAVLLAANLDGLRPIGSEGAIFLAEKILKTEDLISKRTWYIIPLGNPDAAGRYFDKIKLENPGNNSPVNNDLDENTDEDDFNDLNGDGFITVMRKVDPDGNMIMVSEEPRLMRKADPKEGESGVYKIYTEGLDDDNDGNYNEDGKGGVNVYYNFPHLFKHFDTGTGLYPGSAPESHGILDFVFKHPEIAMIVSFGETNFCYNAPQGGRKGEVDLNKIKIPERYAKAFGVDKDKTYTMQEIIDLLEPMVPPGMEITESMVASFLGLGAVVNPLSEDVEMYNKFSKDYKKYLEEKGAKQERFDPEKAKDGSFELWAYYHFGVPVFSMDLWSVNKPVEKKEGGSGITLESLESMSKDDFIALGEEKIDMFLKESGAPEQFNAKKIIELMESGQADPAKMAAMMKQMPKPKKDEKGADPEEKALLNYSDTYLEGKGFVNWEKYDHPTLGEVEIGGFIPYIKTTPPYQMVDSLLELQIPWILQLADNLPDLKIYETKLTDKGSGIYQLEVWIENQNFISFPIAMGKRNAQPYPAVILIEGDGVDLLEGYKRTPVKEVNGHSRIKQTWLIKAKKKSEIKISLVSKEAGKDVKSIKIGG